MTPLRSELEEILRSYFQEADDYLNDDEREELEDFQLQMIENKAISSLEALIEKRENEIVLDVMEWSNRHAKEDSDDLMEWLKVKLRGDTPE